MTEEEFNQLEQNILAEGIRDKLIVWNGIIIDGHNRYAIATKHGLDFAVEEKEFKNRQEAIEWIILNQFGRRNLSTYDRSVLALKLKNMFAEKAKANLSIAGKSYSPKEGCQNSDKVTQKIDTKKELAKIAGVSHDTISKVEKIEQKAPPKVKQKIANGEISINKAYKDIRRQELREEKKVELKQRELPKGVYEVILADPPWRYQFSETQSREIENHYPTMDLENIKSLKVPSADNAVLFLWATAPKLEEALEVLNAWGFTYKTCAVWDKERIGMGYWFRGQHELLLLGTKGTFPTPEPSARVSSVIHSVRERHSTKPEVVYEIIESMFPDRTYLEMFCREPRKGWEVWGNEV